MSDSPVLQLLLQQAAMASEGERLAFLNASAHPLLHRLQQQSVEFTLEQSFKPEINALKAAGFAPGELHGEYDLVLLHPAKDKVQSLGWMAKAFSHLRDGGKLLIACENQYGAKSYESALQKLAGVVNSISKSKCRLFSAKKSAVLDSALQQNWLADAQPRQLESHGLGAQAGLFSWKSADTGSQLLMEHLPQFKGEGMDLCCGYGLLSVALLQSSAEIARLHLVEAERLALDNARKNVAFSTKVELHHLDAAQEALPKHLDWIVCNPPFHSGQSRDVDLGKTIVSRACDSLKDGGELYMVANRQLPYENVLKAKLREVETLAVGQGFKVIRGKK